jgi:hypothetical protein
MVMASQSAGILSNLGIVAIALALSSVVTALVSLFAVARSRSEDIPQILRFLSHVAHKTAAKQDSLSHEHIDAE